MKAERVYVTIGNAVFQRVEKPTLNSHKWRGIPPARTARSSGVFLSLLAGLRDSAELRNVGTALRGGRREEHGGGGHSPADNWPPTGAGQNQTSGLGGGGQVEGFAIIMIC